VHADVEAISQSLEQRGFALDVRTGAKASRDGIFEGYEALIAAHRAEDAAVVYYSGHGGRALSQPVPGVPEYLQFLVPSDFDLPDGTFRGIFAFELSALLARLTAAGRNVTVILDCCHAAMMSRDAETLRPRALPRLWTDGVAERLALAGPQLASLGAESNPYAVRLVATEVNRSAYEAPKPDGTFGGIMTGSLIQALQEAGSDAINVNWIALGARVRELVIRRVPEQRPEVEGPARRLLFQLEETGDAGGIVFFRDRGQPALRASRLLGAVEGAEYGLMPFGVTRYIKSQVVAKALVTAVEGSASRVKLDPANAEIADGSLGFPILVPFQKRAIALDGAAAASVIQDNKFVRAAEHPKDVFATLRAKDGLLCVLDAEGVALTDAVPDDDAGRKYVGSVLAGLARSDALRLLPTGDLPGALHVSWGRVVDGKRICMEDGDMLHVGERLFVDVTNDRNNQIYMALLDLGIGGDVKLLTTSIPSGIPIAPGGRYTVGERDGILTGLKIGWKKGVPEDGPRREGIIAIAAEEQTNFRALEGEVDPLVRDRAQLTPLDALMRKIGFAASRDAETEGGAGGRYNASQIEFQLSPYARPVPSRRASFAVDQSLSPAFLTRDVPEDESSEREIAIRLKSLIVHNNRAYWSTDIRVDALVVTAAAKGDAPYMPRTFCFPRIGDEDRLPFDDLLVYAGRPERYLDFSLWVSKAKSDTKPLSELIKDVLKDTEFQAAATTLLGLAAAAPAAGGLVAATAAAGTIGYFADKVISAAAGSSIGLYRTSFLPRQAFGRGMHPTTGMIRAQDFSLAFEITDTSAVEKMIMPGETGKL
jgi:hypothetical protein